MKIKKNELSIISSKYLEKTGSRIVHNLQQDPAAAPAINKQTSNIFF